MLENISSTSCKIVDGISRLCRIVSISAVASSYMYRYRSLFTRVLYVLNNRSNGIC
jgi:hypothetical protein